MKLGIIPNTAINFFTPLPPSISRATTRRCSDVHAMTTVLHAPLYSGRRPLVSFSGGRAPTISPTISTCRPIATFSYKLRRRTNVFAKEPHFRPNTARTHPSFHVRIMSKKADSPKPKPKPSAPRPSSRWVQLACNCTLPIRESIERVANRTIQFWIDTPVY